MKRIADGRETAVLIPVIRDRVEVELPMSTIAVDIGHVALPDRAVIICNASSAPPPFEYS